MFVLRSSKTHTESMQPQIIKISSNSNSGSKAEAWYCPYAILRKYIKTKKYAKKRNEAFFMYRDRSEVTADEFRKVLRLAIKKEGFDETLYNCQLCIQIPPRMSTDNQYQS